MAVGCIESTAGPTATPSGSIIEAVTTTPLPSVAASPTAAPSPTPEAVAADRVSILYTTFNPASIRVAVGTTVTWFNEDGRAHSVRSSANSSETFYSGLIGGKQEFKHTFNTAGTFEYYDDLTNVARGVVYVG